MERSQALVAAGAGVKIAVCLQHRFRAAAERLGAILAEGGLGKIVACSTKIPLWRTQAYYDEPGRGVKARDGGGVLITQGIHTLDLMLSLAGPVEEVCGYAVTSAVHRMETEDLACAAVRFKNGAVGTIEATTAAYPGGEALIDFIGTKGTASLAGTALSVRWHDGRREDLPAESSGGGGADPMAFPHDHHLAVWRDFLDAIDHNREPRVSAREALKVHRLIDAILEAGETGGKVKVANSE
jgi:UDP-N-acetyl-2-amino-2-deoxyglucuronate dehydrogenase